MKTSLKNNPITATPVPADTYGPINIQSGKVSKNYFDTGGKTAHRSQWISAPYDRYFVENSWKFNLISSKGKNTFVRVTKIERTPVSITLPSGVVVEHNFATRLFIEAHAETGSGIGQKIAWIEAKFSALTQEFK